MCKAQRGAESSSDRLKKKIWIIGFYVQEELRRSLQKGEIESRWISFRNLSAVRSDRSNTRFTIGKSQGEIRKGGLTHRGFTYRESFELMHCGIEKLETQTNGKTVVMGITVIWARSLAKRASA